MVLPGRDTYYPQYRYGFNGKENELDFRGIGRIIDYGKRTADVRLGRFISIDPLIKQYPWYSSYQYAGNKPTIAIDLDGLEEFVKTNWYNQSGNVYRSTLEFNEKAAPLNGTYIYSVHNYVNAEGIILSATIKTENLSSLDFLNSRTGYNNQRGFAEYDIKDHDSPVFQMPAKNGNVSLYMEFTSGAGSENTVIKGGRMIEEIKSMESVKKITRDAIGSFLMNDGKITSGETFTGSYRMPRSKAPSIWIPGILSDTKNPNNKLYGTEHFLGSFSLTIQMLEDGKTAIFTLADGKSLESQTDHQFKGTNFGREDGKRKPLSSTYQRYIWTANIPSPIPPDLNLPTRSDNTTNNIQIRPPKR